MSSKFHRKKKEFLIFVFLIILIFTIYKESRAFAFALCSVALVWYELKKKQNKGQLMVISVLLPVAFVLLLVLAFAVKKDSTCGRLLIYKVSWKIFRDSFPDGIGAGKFESVYLDYQSEYFNTGAYTQKELLLADNTYTTFNDYWLFVLEWGIAAVISLLVFFTSLTIMIKRCFAMYGRRIPFLLEFSLLMLFVLLIAALFTHVFSHPHFLFCALLSLSVLIFYAFFERDKSAVVSYIICCAILTGAAFITKFKYRILHRNANEKWVEAQNLYFAGFVTDGISIMETIYPQMMEQGNLNYLFYYSHALIKNNQFQKAIGLINDAIIKKPSNILYENLGICYEALGQTSTAERTYLKAVYMVPNRFGTRYKLFNFYLATLQYRKADETARQLLALPIKIPSAQVDYIRNSVEMKMRNLKY